MTEADLDRAARFEAEARGLHCRSRAAATLPGSILLGFRRCGRKRRLQIQRNRWAIGASCPL